MLYLGISYNIPPKLKNLTKNGVDQTICYGEVDVFKMSKQPAKCLIRKGRYNCSESHLHVEKHAFRMKIQIKMKNTTEE